MEDLTFVGVVERPPDVFDNVQDLAPRKRLTSLPGPVETVLKGAPFEILKRDETGGLSVDDVLVDVDLWLLTTSWNRQDLDDVRVSKCAESRGLGMQTLEELAIRNLDRDRFRAGWIEAPENGRHPTTGKLPNDGIWPDCPGRRRVRSGFHSIRLLRFGMDRRVAGRPRLPQRRLR